MDAMNTTNTGRYLLFDLAGESYAFAVVKTREVLFYDKIYPLPNAEAFIAGVINLRGSVIPIVDLRQKLGFQTIEPDLNTAIIVLEIDIDNEQAVIGTLVDSVKGVIPCNEEELEDPPKYGLKLDSVLVKKILKRQNDFILILNADMVFGDTDPGILEEGIK